MSSDFGLIVCYELRHLVQYIIQKWLGIIINWLLLVTESTVEAAAAFSNVPEELANIIKLCIPTYILTWSIASGNNGFRWPSYWQRRGSGFSITNLAVYWHCQVMREFASAPKATAPRTSKSIADFFLMGHGRLTEDRLYSISFASPFTKRDDAPQTSLSSITSWR